MELVQELGFPSGAKVLVVHVDDVGVCAAANRGFLRARSDAATCGSVMMPCVAAVEIARLAADRPELDLGVHLTLNCEYSMFRFGPVAQNVPTLVATDGALWRTPLETLCNASIEDVERELRAQIDLALDLGIDVTHLDSHMGTVLHVQLIPIYVKLAREYRLPMFLPRVDREQLRATGMPDALPAYRALWEEAEASGFPVFDAFDNDSLAFAPGSALSHNRERVRRMSAGLGYLITHCAEEDAELESISPSWKQRVEECQIYSDGSMRRIFEEEGVHTLGMRALRDHLRARAE